MAPAAPKTAPAHPPYLTLITEAIKALKERGGSSQPAIKKYIGSHHKLPTGWEKTLSVQLKRQALAGKLVRVKASYKLGEALKKPAKVTKPKKVVVKKVAAAKKPTKPKAPVVKKVAPAKKPAVKKATPAKKPVVKVAPAKKPVVKKAAPVKKPVAKKAAPAKKPVAKKAAVPKVKKAPTKKAAAKK